VWLEVEIKPRLVLKLQRPLSPVRPAPDNHEGGHETDNLEVFNNLRRVPDLAMLRFQRLTACRLGVDLNQSLTTNRFSWVFHVISVPAGDVPNQQLVPVEVDATGL
jgi:hypothetical protein